MIFVTSAIYIVALPMKETYKPIILARRAKKSTSSPGTAALKRTLIANVLRPMQMSVTEVRTIQTPSSSQLTDLTKPVVFFLSMYTAFAFGVLFLMFAAFPYIFTRPPYSFSISQSGLTFLAIGLGVLLGGLTGVLIDDYMYQARYRAAVARGETNAAPEHRLYNAMIGSWGIAISLFWMGWSADKGAHWAVVLVGSVPFGWGNMCVMVSTCMPSYNQVQIDQKSVRQVQHCT